MNFTERPKYLRGMACKNLQKLPITHWQDTCCARFPKIIKNRKMTCDFISMSWMNYINKAISHILGQILTRIVGTTFGVTQMTMTGQAGAFLTIYFPMILITCGMTGRRNNKAMMKMMVGGNNKNNSLLGPLLLQTLNLSRLNILLLPRVSLLLLIQAQQSKWTGTLKTLQPI